ncbi:hypothetical protein [Acinetobacter sp. 1125_18A]|uniref:hypothetical protein n=1 Tax=Acinetobacter sp. 1125_18A TaxID=2605959 RepID=UPI0040584EAE
MLKRIMIFLTSILLLLNSALVNATTINGWFLSNPTAVGASILYDGTKGSLASSVLISPNASQIAKVLRGGIAGYALTFAVEQLLGAVDWVLDPANNQIKYKYEEFGGTYYDQLTKKTFATAKEAADSQCRYFFKQFAFAYDIENHSETQFKANCDDTSTSTKPDLVIYPLITSPPIITEKHLSLITAAEQVIENAESDNLDAQFAVLAAATNILSDAEQDDAEAKPIADELENNSKCPSGIVRNGSCWICDKSLFMPYTRATRDAKTATRGKSCKNITDTTIKASNAVLFRNLINARVQENACWSPPDQNHATALVDAQNALSLCEN